MTKICRICHQEKPLTAFGVRSVNPPRRRNECYQCKYLLGQGLLVPWHAPQDPGMKLCPGCKNLFPLEEFPPSPTKKHPARRQHRCKACTKRFWQERYLRLRDKHLAKEKAYRAKDPDAYRAKTNARLHAAYHNNPVHRQRVTERTIANLNHRRGLLFVEPVHTDVLFKRDKGICQLCQEPVERKDASRDHIIPAADGGEYSYRNMQLAHKWCNSRKGHRRTIPSQLRIF